MVVIYYLKGQSGGQRGDPVKAVKAIVDVVRGEGFAKGKVFPMALALGVDAYEVMEYQLAKSRATLEEWKELTNSTDFD